MVLRYSLFVNYFIMTLPLKIYNRHQLKYVQGLAYKYYIIDLRNLDKANNLFIHFVLIFGTATTDEVNTTLIYYRYLKKQWVGKRKS